MVGKYCQECKQVIKSKEFDKHKREHIAESIQTRFATYSTRQAESSSSTSAATVPAGIEDSQGSSENENSSGSMVDDSMDIDYNSPSEFANLSENEILSDAAIEEGSFEATTSDVVNENEDYRQLTSDDEEESVDVETISDVGKEERSYLLRALANFQQNVESPLTSSNSAAGYNLSAQEKSSLEFMKLLSDGNITKRMKEDIIRWINGHCEAHGQGFLSPKFSII